MRNIAVVLLRGCWLDGTNKCLKNGAAEVETLFLAALLPQKFTATIWLSSGLYLLHWSLQLRPQVSILTPPSLSLFSPLWSIAGQQQPPLPTSFSSSWSGLRFTSSPFVCFNLSPDPASSMLVNSAQAHLLAIEKMREKKKKKLRGFGHEARSGLPCDSERGGRGAGMDAGADADSSRHLHCRHPSVAAHLVAHSHICIFTHTRCAEALHRRKVWLDANLHASPTHSQLPCLPVGWWLQQVTFADIAVIMAL